MVLFESVSMVADWPAIVTIAVSLAILDIQCQRMA